MMVIWPLTRGSSRKLRPVIWPTAFTPPWISAAWKLSSTSQGLSAGALDAPAGVFWFGLPGCTGAGGGVCADRNGALEPFGAGDVGRSVDMGSCARVTGGVT